MTTKPAFQIRTDPKYAHIEPLPDPPKKWDGMQESRFIFNARFIIERRFHERNDVLVNGYGYLCHNTRNRSDWTVPDVIVSFGVDPRAVEARNGYVIDEVGKPPEFVLEVASKTTAKNDYTHKRQSYANLGVAEYWRFDETGGKLHDRPLAGDLLLPNGDYQPVPLRTGSDGIIRGYSPILGLELCWDDQRLRFYDPQTAQFLPDEKETAALAKTAQTRADAAEILADAALTQAAESQTRANAAEARAAESDARANAAEANAAEAQTRAAAAEAHAAESDAEVRRLREELRRRPNPPSNS